MHSVLTNKDLLYTCGKSDKHSIKSGIDEDLKKKNASTELLEKVWNKS